ncbi:4516_t:CDS:10 [Rhizophagus irregularis]|nr:4516_t:CDS:10 [Rhizophagus irregularis]
MNFLRKYETFKIVKVKDRRLGILYRVFQVAILAYILFTIFNDESYLKKEPPIPGAIRITLQAPNTFTNQPYCTGGDLPCVYWGANEIQYPSDGAGFAFFTTRATVTSYPPGTCNFLTASSPNDPCVFNPITNPSNVIVPKSYIGDIESHTVMIEHSIRGKVNSISLRNGVMDGVLKDSNGNTIKRISNATRTLTDPKANGDIFTVKELLDAAGVDLDGPSFAPGAAPGEINRSSAEYKATENIYNPDGSYTIKDRHGIRFVFQQIGQIGSFNAVSLLTNLVAALALFKVATTLVELLMLHVLPQKEHYGTFKYEETHDFGDFRKGILSREKENNGEVSAQP